VTVYIAKWFIRTRLVTRPSTNPAVHGRQLNLLITSLTP